MSRIAAIDISASEAVVVAAETSDSGQIELHNLIRVPIESLHLQSEDTNGEEDTEENAEEDQSVNLLDSPRKYGSTILFSDLEQAALLKELFTLEIEDSLALIRTDQILYREIDLPFDDTKKIDQIAPMQVQDKLPLEVDEFFLDSIVLNKKQNGNFGILSSLVPIEAIRDTIGTLSELGTDPKLITTKASAISSLKNLFPEQLNGSFALLEVSLNSVSVAIFINDEIVNLRDIPLASTYRNRVRKDQAEIEEPDSNKNEPAVASEVLLDALTINEVNCSLLSAQNKFPTKLKTVHVIAPPQILKQCQDSLKLEVKSVDLSSKVSNRTEQDIAIQDISWAVGLFASEISPADDKPPQLVDFRSGPFAHKRLWKNLFSALSEEMFFIGLALFFFLGWFGSVVYMSSASLNQIETRISETLRISLPGESIPFRREIPTLEANVEELEEQLRGMGSLSSLSPLETLKALSSVIPKQLDTEIDTLNIAESLVSFRGSVADTPSVGRLSSALEQNDKRFCQVKVDPKGKLPGSSRVRFTAEIELCE